MVGSPVGSLATTIVLPLVVGLVHLMAFGLSDGGMVGSAVGRKYGVFVDSRARGNLNITRQQIQTFTTRQGV